MPVGVSGRSVKTRNTVEGSLLIGPTTPAGVQPVGQSGWNVVFSDEFASPMVVSDLANGLVNFGGPTWRAWYPPDHPGFVAQGAVGPHTNNPGTELQYYDTTGLSCAGSVLTLSARKQETFTGLPYTSGMIQSRHTFAATYGYMEARMRLPGTSGSWPAFWTLASSYTWPPELDVMENFGSATIAEASNQASGRTVFADQNNVGDVTAWHTYALKWTSTQAVWFYDGTVVATESNTAAVPQVPMYLLANLAINSSTAAACAVDIDYIRFWQ